MKPDETFALARVTLNAIAQKACVHPEPHLRALGLATAVLRVSTPRFDQLVGLLFAPPPIAQLTPKPQAQVLRELHELHQQGAAIVGAVLAALDQLAPLPPPGALSRVNGGGRR